MKKTLLALLFLLFSKMASAKDYGIHGVVYTIKEKNLLEEIQEKLQQARQDGRLEKFQNNVKEKIFQQVNNPHSTINLPKTLINRSW
jgi:hypothetical protein